MRKSANRSRHFTFAVLGSGHRNAGPRRGAFATEYHADCSIMPTVYAVHPARPSTSRKPVKQTADMLKNTSSCRARLRSNFGRPNALASCTGRSGARLFARRISIRTFPVSSVPGYGHPQGYYANYDDWSQTSPGHHTGCSSRRPDFRANNSRLNRRAQLPSGYGSRISEQANEALHVMGQIANSRSSSSEAARTDDGGHVEQAELSGRVIQRQAASEAATREVFNWTPEVSDGTKFQSGWK